MKRKLIILSTALLIIVGAVMLSSFFARQKKDPEIKKPFISKKKVSTRKVAYESIDTDVVAFGRVETSQSLDLLSEVSGRMYGGKVRLKAGQRFRKGDLLFYIDDKEASLDLKAQKSNFLRDLAAILPDLKIDFNPNYSNWNKYFKELDIDAQFPELPVVNNDKEKTFLATKGIYSSYYSIKSAEARLAKHRYFAPFDGSITQVTFQSGSFVNPGVSIGKIIRTGFHELKVSIETKDIQWIARGSEVEIYSSEMGVSWLGEVSRIGDFVNQNTQSVDVFVTIFPNGQKIYDGQFFQATIPARTVKNGMIMPRNAIYNGNEVFVVNDTLLKMVKVNLLRLSDEEAIFNGLQEGTDLVIEPLIGAYNNMIVEKNPINELDLEIKTSNERKVVESDSQTSGI